jgi:hypothetical protein
MTKYLVALCIFLCMALGALGFLYRSEARKADVAVQALKVATEAAAQAQARSKKDRAALVAREASKASEGRKSAQAQESLQKAVQGEKAWSEAVVPDSVKRAILEGSDASDSVSN